MTKEEILDYVLETPSNTNPAILLGMLKQLSNEQFVIFVPNVSPDGVLSWSNEFNLPNPPSVNIKGNVGLTGASGLCGREIEFRKTASHVEYRYSQNIKARGLYGSVGTYIPTALDDSLKEISIYQVSNKVKYAKIKTVTIYGGNELGEEILNINYGEPTPQDTNLDFLGGFSPKAEPIQVLNRKVNFIGNLLPAKVKEAAIPEFGNPKIKKITRIIIQIVLWDENKSQIGDLVDIELLIDETIKNQWIQLFDLSQITAIKTTADDAMALATTNEEDIRVNEQDMELIKANYTELFNNYTKLSKQVAEIQQQLLPK